MTDTVRPLAKAGRTPASDPWSAVVHQRIRTACLRLGLARQADIAAELGVSERTVRRWLTGEDEPSAKALVKAETLAEQRRRAA